MMNIFAGKSSPSHMQIRAQSILVQMLEKECSLVYGGQSENENFPDEDYSDDNVDEDFTAADSKFKHDITATIKLNTSSSTVESTPDSVKRIKPSLYIKTKNIRKGECPRAGVGKAIASL